MLWEGKVLGSSGCFREVPCKGGEAGRADRHGDLASLHVTYVGK